MDLDELLTVGNITTIVNWIVNLILPYVASYGIGKDVLASIIVTFLWFCFTVFNSANPNTLPFLGNKVTDVEDVSYNLPVGDIVLNEEYEEEVNNEEGC